MMNKKLQKAVVECCDFLLPFAGETFGSSRREINHERIKRLFYNGSMYKQLKERFFKRYDVENTKKAEKIINVKKSVFKLNLMTAIV